MPIRRISPDVSRTKDDSMSPTSPERAVFRRNIGLKVKPDVNLAEESSLFVDSRRRKREIVAWSCLNLLLILLASGDFFNGTMPVYLLRVLQGIAVIVGVCNVLYYAVAYVDFKKRMDLQKIRLKMSADSTSNPPPKKGMEFVRYKPLDTECYPSYWRGFQSIFKKFQRLTARNQIAFFANDTQRGGVEPEVMESPQPNTASDVKHVFSDTLTKYKGRIITTARDLRQYLTDHKIATENEFVKTSEDSHLYLDSSDFWASRRRNLSDNCMDVSPLLRRSEYQSSPSSSDSSVCSSKESGCTNREFYTLLWDRYKIESSAFIYWISNFRMWLSKTVIARVVSEMAVVDNGLKTLRLSGLSIGNVGLETLEDAYRNPQVAHQLPSLSYLLPFLRVSTKQNYVVARYRTLAQGHGMCDFRWNSGGDAGGKAWETGYPTDAELLMHLFATYLDQQLPLSPSTFPHSDTSKPFSSQYLADSAVSAKQKRICIIRKSLNPPHFDLLVDGEVQELPPGRNNLFYAIVLFLYCVKVYEHGMLGRISLGKHGIDMLWIIDEKGI